MAIKIFTNTELNDYFNGRVKHAIYDRTVRLAKRLTRHADGDDYGELITDVRPGESDKIKNYRIKIIVEKTKQTFSSVLSELNKIRKSDDWAIKYDKEKLKDQSLIRDGEKLNDYCEKKFPFFTSIENWLFKVWLKRYACDAHAVIMMQPLEYIFEQTDFAKPYPVIFPASRVIDFKENEYAVLKSSKRSRYLLNTTSQTYFEGDIFYVVNTQTIERYEQLNDKREFKKAAVYTHNLNYLPARLMKGVVLDTEDEYTVYESRFMPMAASLDEAIRMYSDLQAEWVQHVHSEKWVWSNQKCTTCSGNGQVLKQGKGIGESTWGPCPACKGQGIVMSSPYSNYLITPPAVGEQAVPIPPVGYIEKNTEMAKFLYDVVKDQQYDALASINMQFLWKVPLVESGIAKQVDYDALNTFTTTVSEDLVDTAIWMYKVTNDMRYLFQYPDEKVRDEWLPNINIPYNFSILSADYLIEEIKKARDGQLNPIIVNSLEKEYAIKQFFTEPEIRDELQMIMELDPLSGYSQEDKDAMKGNSGITDINYIISCNIRELIRIAMEEDKGFMKKKYKEKFDKIKELAKVIDEEMTASMEVINPLEPVITENEPQPV